MSGSLGEEGSTAIPPPKRSAGTVAFGRPGAKAALIGPATFFGLIFLSGVVVPSTAWWEKLLLGLLAVSLAVCLARIGSLAVIATPGQLVIRNIRNRHRIP